MAEPVPIKTHDHHVERLFEQIDAATDEQLRVGHVSVAAAIGILEMIKLKLYDSQRPD